MRKLLLALLFPALAQAADLGGLANVPVHVLPAVAVQKSIAQTKGEALRFAVLMPLAVNLDGGLWDVSPEGQARWRTQVASGGAQSLQLFIEALSLPETAQLWVYSRDGALQHGPFTAADRHAKGSLALPPLRTEQIVLEVRLPAAQISRLDLKLSRAAHGYLDYTKSNGQFGDSGTCNINAICADGDAWRNELRAAAKLIVGGTSLCSGTLLNNVEQDNRALLLTANHCGMTATNAPDLIAYWNFQTAACTGSRTADDTQFSTGSTLRASSGGGDYAIVEFTTNPLTDSRLSPKPFLAGFDASGTGGSSGVGLHHPAGDVKKISTYSRALERVDGACAAGTNLACSLRVDGWRMFWDAGKGVTEGGSSGSGLWNQNRQIVGLLSGGASSCETPAEEDIYARLDSAWVNGLSAVLDPRNRNIRQACGREGNSSSCATSGSTGGGLSGGGSSGGGSFGSSSGAISPLLLLLALGAIARRAWRV